MLGDRRQRNGVAERAGRGAPAPGYVQDSDSGKFLYGNGSFRTLFDVSPPPVVNGEYHDTGKDRWYVLHSHPLCWMDGRQASPRAHRRHRGARARELIAKHRDAAHRTARLIALGEFASAVAHELNQPLAAIATYNHSCMRMLQSGKPDPEKLLQAMHICRDQAKRAGRIIQRLRGCCAPGAGARRAGPERAGRRRCSRLSEPHARRGRHLRARAVGAPAAGARRPAADRAGGAQPCATRSRRCRSLERAPASRWRRASRPTAAARSRSRISATACRRR